MARRPAPRGALLGVALLAALGGGCRLESRDRGPFAPGPGFSQPESAFESPWEIVRAIRDGTFAERVDLPELPAAAPPLPEPLRVPFPGGTEVPASEAARIEAFAERVRSDPAIALRIVGCSDPSGAAATNLRLSQQRAEAVAARLAEQGIAEDRFAAVVGRGEDCEVQERAVVVTPTRAGEGQAA